MTIEIDFDIYKQLTLLRKSEEETYSEVIKKILEAFHSSKTKVKPPDERGLVCKKVNFFNGTKFRAFYKGKYYYAEVKDQALIYNGEKFYSPSPAAIAVTGTSTNGWTFWECLYPGDLNWVSIDKMRKSHFIGITN